jgi:hypothetical protein
VSPVKTEESHGDPREILTAATEGTKTAKIRSTNEHATPKPIPFFKIPFFIFSPKPTNQ